MTLVIDNISELVTNDPALGGRPARRRTPCVGGHRHRHGVGSGTGRGHRRRAPRRRRPVRAARVRGLPHPPGVRGRPCRGVLPADGGRALRRGRDPGHHRRHPDRGVGRAEDRARTAAGRGPPGRHDHGGDQDRLRAVGGLRGRAGLGGCRGHTGGHVPGRPPCARRVPGPGRRVRRAGVRADARRGARPRPLDRRVLRDRRVRRRPVPGRARGGPGRGAWPAAPRQPARPRTRRAARRRDGLRVGGPLHLPLRRRHRGSGLQRHRGHVPAGHRLLHPPALPRRPAGHRRRRQGGDRLELQSGLELHHLAVVLHRHGRSRHGHDHRRSRRRRDRLEGRAHWAGPTSGGSPPAVRPTRPSSTRPAATTSPTGPASH